MAGNIEDFKKIIERLGLSVKNLSLYQTAFIHRSYLNETKEAIQSNERLEFLGDAVLSLIVSSFLYTNRPQDSEGDLTNLRAYIVKTESLSQAAQKLSLGSFLRLSKGEELSGGRENPQILANTYEAVLGAIYLDLGLEAAQEFVQKTLLSLFIQTVEKGAPKDPKSKLQELTQDKMQTSPKYKTLKTLGPDHAKQFVIGVYIQGKLVGEGSGSSKQQAEEEAANQALVKLSSEQQKY